MKKLITGSLIALSLITNLQAETSEVKAEIKKECIISSLTPTVNFGDNINPLEPQTNDRHWAQPGNLASGIYADWQCSKSTPLMISFSSANNYKLKETITSEEIPYYYHEAGGRTYIGTGITKQSGWGLELTIDPSIKPGHYTDTITTTFTW